MRQQAKTEAQKIMELSDRELLKLAETVRSIYVEQVRKTQVKLDPNRLRSLDKEIADLRKNVRG
jgi:hypothetical protein